MRVGSLALCGVAVVCLTGCPSFSTLGLARPLKKGSLQVVLAPEFEGLTVDLTSVGGGVTPIYVPQGELAVHYGVTDNFELGGKAWLFGAQLEGKYGFIVAPTMESGFDLSLGLGVSYLGLGAGGAGVGVATFSVPLQFGINFGGNQLVLSPKLVDSLFVGSGNLVMVGGSAGIALKVGDELRIMPEVTVIYPLASQSSTGGAFTGFQGVIFQGGIALMFGGKYDSPPPAALPP